MQDVLNRTDYVEANWKATPAFPGHNHYVRCAISYDDQSTVSKKYYACKETLDIYMLAHSGDRTRTIFMRHIPTPAARRSCAARPRASCLGVCPLT